MVQTEVYYEIKDYYGYKINSYGQIISFRKKNSKELYETPKVLKQLKIITHCGKQYARVSLSGKYKFVHRLVAQTFIPNPENKPQVNHKDGNSLNNDLDNLEWATNSENQIHRFKMNGTKNSLGQYVHKNRETYRVYKKGVVDKCFNTLNEAREFAKQYY